MLRNPLLFFLALMPGSFLNAQQLEFKESPGKVCLWDDDQLVFCYQIETVSQQGAYPRANYLHPVNDFHGDPITEDFPEDHPHHRGIFWSWHQLLLNGKSIADPWMCENIVWEVRDHKLSVDNQKAVIQAKVDWQIGEKRQKVLREDVHIAYFRLDDHYQLDFTIDLLATVEGLELGGSRDEKGYGGFSPRLLLSDEVKFFYQGLQVIPQNTMVQAGDWLQMTGIGKNNAEVIVMYHPQSTAQLRGWILRDKGSMQNPVWPGNQPLKLPTDQPYTIKVRMLIARESLSDNRIEQLFMDFKAADQ